MTRIYITKPMNVNYKNRSYGFDSGCFYNPVDEDFCKEILKDEKALKAEDYLKELTDEELEAIDEKRPNKAKPVKKALEVKKDG